ncbi:CDP-alcohol phosphatidyltransferase family protein [Patescibacteria group bacterium]
MSKKRESVEKSFYGKFEMGIMLKINKTKHKIFLPLIKVLNKLKINANHISILSGIITIISFYLAIYYSNPLFFIIGIWVHMVLDGLDGSLARYQKKDSSRGTIVDVAVDQLGITLMCLFVIYFSYANIVNVSAFFVLYLIVIILSLYLMFKKKRFDIVIRPRIFFYIAVTWDFIIFVRITEVIVLLANIFMFCSVLIGIYHLKQLKKNTH